MKIAIIGSGYVGLVSGACFADFGHEVSCIDVVQSKIDALKEGIIPIYEPGLEDLVKKNAREGRLHFTTSIADGMKDARVVFLAVGTPARRGDGHADLTYVYAAAKEVAAAIKDYTVVVTKSTVPVGTGDEIELILSKQLDRSKFSVVSNPEFLREGAAIGDFKRPDRIVIGLEDERAKQVMAEVYRPLHLNEGPILFTGRRTAELTKYAANAFLATKITFINEIADLCEKVGANVQEVARGIGLDNRIGAKFLHAGPGYGGSCFPKDTRALVKTAEDYDAPTRIVETVVAVNEQRKRAMGRKVVHACGGEVRGQTIALLGLAFKPNTDDMREAPAISIVQALHDAGAHVRAYDPKAMEQAKLGGLDVEYAEDPYACIAGASALVIVTEWDSFRALDLARIKSLLKEPVVVDLRNIYRRGDVERNGLTYTAVGMTQDKRPSH